MTNKKYFHKKVLSYILLCVLVLIILMSHALANLALDTTK